MFNLLISKTKNYIDCFNIVIDIREYAAEDNKQAGGAMHYGVETGQNAQFLFVIEKGKLQVVKTPFKIFFGLKVSFSWF